MDAEIWKPVLGYEGLYEVSSIGRVRTVERVVRGGRTPTSSRTVPAKVRKVSAHVNGGHLWLKLHRNGVRTPRFVHRLVLEAFVGEQPEGRNEVRHLDGNPANNRVENLAYGTHAENVADMLEHGTHRNSRKSECKWGHPFDGMNTYIRPDGNRDCRACAKARKDGSRAA
ncbi:hypothetical protein DW322_11330 [Rhodococcus rhodnii]|uniref:HNH nuclease domain-containing protein n=2 Tax=Rhodococcus rhodnii TaxID=38312 RepID=R7WS24_9NOCA|nr:NUMOD4 motif-containing HNH endonuclease [Rhodococcus rhodnii]EOM78090.1 hypothetical protein Rrhod_0540 [Rhodococcus rhodnii LMG 5362]TXG90701.1 hypothetical protein DW322_11330 [Rhodococcus rhodnii]